MTVSIDPRQAALRAVSQANSRLLSVDDQSLEDAADWLMRALSCVETLRFPYQDPAHVAVGRALKGREG